MNSDALPAVTRRTVMRGVCGATCAAGLMACGGGRGATPAPSATSAPVPSAPAVPTSAEAQPALAATADIPLGGGRIFPDYRLVATQPAAGDLRAFTAICTHDGCVLTTVSDATIGCPCHGSRFAITDGAVVHGPALRGLTPRTITVQGDSIILNP